MWAGHQDHAYCGLVTRTMYISRAGHHDHVYCRLVTRTMYTVDWYATTRYPQGKVYTLRWLQIRKGEAGGGIHIY